jgi:hypothetical protein
MAAASEPYPLEICELYQVPVDELDRLLGEEIDVWARDLSWDFAPSAALVRRFVQSQSLTGFALRVRGELIGYAYQVCDERKGLIGDFYVRPTAHSPSNEMALIGAVVESLMKTPGVRRIESQEEIERLPFRELSHRVSIQPWSDRMHEDAAHVISAAYRGHVDSEINDQYRNIPGARRFVTNIVRFPGCGTFSVQGSCVAVDEHSGRLCGVCLTSAVSETTGHAGMRASRDTEIAHRVRSPESITDEPDRDGLLKGEPHRDRHKRGRRPAL